MISLLQRSLRFIFDSTITPDRWTLDDPIVAANSPGNSNRWKRTMVEIPPLQVRIEKDSQPGFLQSSYILQYRSMFKFPGSLKYAELPMGYLSNVLEYLVFIIQTHPDLLTKTPDRIAAVLGWVPNTDPCPYPNPTTTPISVVQDALTVRELMVNAFVPVVEQTEGHDWLVTLVWSVEVQIYGTVKAYRDFFAIAFNPNDPNNPWGNTGGQITPQPNLIGGKPGLPVSLIRIDLHNDPNMDQDPANPVTVIQVSKDGQPLPEVIIGGPPVELDWVPLTTSVWEVDYVPSEKKIYNRFGPEGNTEGVLHTGVLEAYVTNTFPTKLRYKHEQGFYGQWSPYTSEPGLISEADYLQGKPAGRQLR